MPSLRYLPNALTFSRMLAMPFVFQLFHWHRYEAAIALAGFAALTDFLDGRTARALGHTTELGAILDPVADKVMILSLFGLLASQDRIPLWLFALATVRNVAQLMAIPILLWWKKIGFKVRPRRIPKWASALSYVIILAGLVAAMPGVPPATVAASNAGIRILSVVLACLEVQILVTYCPRFVQIYTGTHDTFE